MRLTRREQERNSENEFIVRTSTLLNDCAVPIVNVETDEPIRAIEALEAYCANKTIDLYLWNVVDGVTHTTSNNRKTTESCNPIEAISKPKQLLEARGFLENGELVDSIPENNGMEFFILHNPYFWMEDATFLHLVEMYISILPRTYMRVIFINPRGKTPEAITSKVFCETFDTMGYTELKDVTSKIVSTFPKNLCDSLSEEDRHNICIAGLGMPLETFVSYFTLGVLENKDQLTGKSIVDSIISGKTDIIRKGNLLELYQPEDISNVGGMDILKEWVRKRKQCFTDEAAKFGIDFPKGIVLLGPPGVGKSLAARTISGELAIPLIRMDFSNMFNKMLGSSEERIRTSLAKVDSLSPTVLFIDEIDKGLGGINSGTAGDGGTSQRVMGTFLTWLADNKRPVFTVVTANNIMNMPPELFRRGRWDAIFYVDPPNRVERQEILEIHLRKRGRDLSCIKSSLDEILDKTQGYTGAEIETGIKDGLVDAFSANRQFSSSFLLKALSRIKPITAAYKQQFSNLSDWASYNAIPASSPIVDSGSRKKPVGRIRKVQGVIH